MLKNKDIINNLSDDQKILLATDLNAAALDNIVNAGVPRIESASLDSINALYGGDATYPALDDLSSSWNPKLITQTVSDIVQRSGAEKYNMIVCPDVSLKSSPFASGLSEDPYLSAKLGGSAVTAIEEAGAAACLTGGSLRGIDVDHADIKPNDRAINELYCKAFDMVMRNREPSAVLLSAGKLKGAYKDENYKIVERAAQKNTAKTVIAGNAYEEALRSGIGKDKLLFFGCSPAAVRSALKNYRRMKEDVERGSVSLEELKTAIERGTAISPDSIDIAVDNVIEFGKKLQRARKHYAAGAGQSDYSKRQTYFAAQESIVLLKNADNKLPLKAVRVGVMGDILSEYPDAVRSIERFFGGYDATYVGYAEGYRLDQERSDELLSGAAALAGDSDVIVAFVGFGSRREAKLGETRSVKLPANQLVALETAARAQKPIVAVVCGSIPDMKFDNGVAAVLTLPLGGSGTLGALFDTIFGVTVPGGKLACSAYDDTDEVFGLLKSSVRSGRLKVGEFVGYRRYTSENRRIKYPFGHGLSYTRFEYSDLIVRSDSVEVTVKNTGSVSGYEVAQLYVGKVAPAFPRPVKELKGFAKTLIAPGASMHITFPLTSAMLETYDDETGSRKTEGGRYNIYVGSSCADIRLTGVVDVPGATINGREKMGDYLEGFDMPTRGFNTADKKGFNSAREGEAFSFEKLFSDEFEESDAPALDEDDDQEQQDFSIYVDDGVTAKTLVGWLIAAGKSRGVSIDQATAREIVGAMSASRAVMLRCSQAEFDMIVDAVSAFCGSAVVKDDCAKCEKSDDLFIKGNDTALTGALAFADSHRDVMTLVCLDNVKTNDLGEIFVPFIRYATAPDYMTVSVGAGKRKLAVSPNVWFMMRLDERGCKRYPVYIADFASVIAPKVGRIAPVGGVIVSPNYYQFLAACAAAENELDIDEALWKRYDKLEKFVRSRTEFKTDNKMFVQMEKIMAVCTLCGAEPAEALDTAVGMKIVPHIVYALSGKLLPDDPELPVLFGNCFGDDNIGHCMTMLNLFIG